MNYDNTCKYLAEQYPNEFVKWLINVDTDNTEVLKTELNLDPIYADSVTFLRTENQILHLEFQTKPQSNPPIPLRMLDYSVRLKRLYRCSVLQIVIFLQETNNQIAFTEEYQDETTTHRYQVIRIWEENSAMFLDSPALLPFATLTQTDSPQVLLTQVAQKVAKIADKEQRQNLGSCAEILAGLRFNRDLIRSFFREDIMKESVIYQDILQQGRQQGRRQESLLLVTRLIKKRFGEIESTLIDRISILSVEKLEALIEALFDMSDVADLVTWLQDG